MNPLKELEGLDAGRQLALVKKLGGREVVNAILRGEKTVTVEDAIRLFFDKHGRRIPEGLQANVCDAKWIFRLEQPKLDEENDFADRIFRLHECLGINTRITAEQFMAETKRMLAIIMEKSQIANITNGVYLPVIIPRFMTDDLGVELDLYLDGVARSYVKTFGDRKFHNFRKGTLANKVSVVEGSRHDRLIERMKEGPVIGLHFPNSLQGFSIRADREQMLGLSRRLILSGMDTVIAMTMYPDKLARDWHTPGLDLAALQWHFGNYSFNFRADGAALGFSGTDSLASAAAEYSGGLLFLG